MRWWRPVLPHRVLDSLGLVEKLNVVCSAQVPRRDARIDPTLAWRASDRDWTVGGFPVAGMGWIHLATATSSSGGWRGLHTEARARRSGTGRTGARV
jgi:hypothetical protein